MTRDASSFNWHRTWAIIDSGVLGIRAKGLAASTDHAPGTLSPGREDDPFQRPVSQCRRQRRPDLYYPTPRRLEVSDPLPRPWPHRSPLGTRCSAVRNAKFIASPLAVPWTPRWQAMPVSTPLARQGRLPAPAAARW